MDTFYPYRIAWHKPKDINVCAESRAKILDAMEYGFPTSKHRLEILSDMGSTTVRYAYRQLIREGVLQLEYGPDPDSGRASDLITPVRYPVLPVLEITDTHMVWRLCDTLGDSVFATVRDRGGFCSPEDDLTILMGQVSKILRAGTCGLPAKVPLQPPVLILPSSEQAFIRTIRHVFEQSPAFVQTPEEAAAAELRYHPTTRNATSILHLRMGETPAVTLFLRTHSDDPLSPFAPAACGGGLSETFRAYTQDASPHTKAWWQQIAAFLADACRFITPDCVVVETDRPRVSLPIRPEMFPRSTRVIRMRYALNTPSLAHRGAVRLNRRILWDSMMGDSPEYTL